MYKFFTLAPAPQRKNAQHILRSVFNPIKTICVIIFTFSATALASLGAIYTAYPMVQSWLSPSGLLQVSDGGDDEIVALVNNRTHYSDVISSAWLDITGTNDTFFNVALTIRDSDEDIGPFQTKAIVLSLPPSVKAASFFKNPNKKIKVCRIMVFVDGISINTHYEKDYPVCAFQFELMKRSHKIS